MFVDSCLCFSGKRRKRRQQRCRVYGARCTWVPTCPNQKRTPRNKFAAARNSLRHSFIAPSQLLFDILATGFGPNIRPTMPKQPVDRCLPTPAKKTVCYKSMHPEVCNRSRKVPSGSYLHMPAIATCNLQPAQTCTADDSNLAGCQQDIACNLQLHIAST